MTALNALQLTRTSAPLLFWEQIFAGRDFVGELLQSSATRGWQESGWADLDLLDFMLVSIYKVIACVGLADHNLVNKFGSHCSLLVSWSKRGGTYGRASGIRQANNRGSHHPQPVGLSP